MLQQNLFDFETEYFNIKEASHFLNVSSATIRNWIKADYFELVGKNKISKKSVTDFKKIF